MRIRFSISVFLCISFCKSIYAQDLESDMRRYDRHFYAEAVNLPSDSSGLCRVDVYARVAYNFIVFTRTNKTSYDSLFFGEVTLSTDLHSVDNKRYFSSFSKASLYVSDYSVTDTKDKFVLFKQTFYLPPEIYLLNITVDEGQSTRQKQISTQIHAKLIDNSAITIGSVIPIEQPSSGLMPPFNVVAFGGNVLFGNSSYVAVSSNAKKDALWRFVLRRKIYESEYRIISDTNLSPIAQFENMTGKSRDGIVSKIVLDTVAQTNGTIHLFRLPFDTIDYGRYVLALSVEQESLKDSIEQNFQILWRDIPFSLQDIEFAIKTLRYILTEEEISMLDEDSIEEREEKFRAFWKKKDPTPSTAYNEHLTEYYKRVDQAYYKFHTLSTPNGALTDRGKIYVLYGPPEDVKRILHSKAPMEETWIYPSLKKTFQFIDREQNGDLRLAK